MSGIIGGAGSKSGIIDALKPRVHLGTYTGNDSSSDTDYQFMNIYQGGRFAYNIIEINSLGMDTDNQAIKLRLINSSGSKAPDTEYQWVMDGMVIETDGNSGAFTDAAYAANAFELFQYTGNAAGECYNATLKVTGLGANAAEFVHVTGNSSAHEFNGKLAVNQISGTFDAAGDYWGFHIYGGQNFDSGTISVYGIMK